MPTVERKPKFFIGSTWRVYAYVEALVRACDDKTQFPEGFPLEPVPWRSPFEDPHCSDASFLDVLSRQAYQCDYGVFFFTPEDAIQTPGSQQQFNVRDNVVFEAGLFVGSKGKNNTLVVVNAVDEHSTKMPTDYVGAIRDIRNLGEPQKCKTNDIEFLQLAANIADRWKAQRFVLEQGTNKILRTREDCYSAGIQIVRKAQHKVATILSYPDEVTDRSNPSEYRWRLDGTPEQLLYLTVHNKALERGVKVYRWMNLGVEAIKAQACALVTLLEQHNLHDELFVRDTYCEFIECIVADDYVLIVLPNERARHNAEVEVGVGLLTRHAQVANYFFDWFEKRIPVRDQKPFTTQRELEEYAVSRAKPPWM